jgi:hypothetical protein
MKYFLPFLACLVLCIQTAQTQNVTISPNPASKAVHADSADVFAHTVVKTMRPVAKPFVGNAPSVLLQWVGILLYVIKIYVIYLLSAPEI